MTQQEAHILIIEADTALADMMMEVLSQDGYHLSLASTVHEAIARLRTQTIDAVILDTDTLCPSPQDSVLTILRAWVRAVSSPPPIVMVSIQAPPELSRPESRAQVGATPSVTWIRSPFARKSCWRPSSGRPAKTAGSRCRCGTRRHEFGFRRPRAMQTL
jgi:CheY-like chemotaxis protein